MELELKIKQEGSWGNFSKFSFILSILFVISVVEMEKIRLKEELQREKGVVVYLENQVKSKSRSSILGFRLCFCVYFL
jgi:hypothetical protein